MIKNRYETVQGGFGLNFWAALAGNPNWSEKRQKTTEMRYRSYFLNKAKGKLLSKNAAQPVGNVMFKMEF